MQIFNTNEQVSAIYNNSLSLLIGKDFADQLNGKLPVADHEDSVGNYSRLKKKAIIIK